MATIRTIQQSPNGMIWIGTDGAEIFQYDGYSFKELAFKGEEITHHTNNISITDKGFVFSSLYKGAFEYFSEKDSIVRISDKDYNAGETIGAYAFKDRRLIINARKIYERVGDSINYLLKRNSNQDNIVVTQVIEHESALFILSNAGAYRYTAGKLTPIYEWLQIDSEEFSSYKFGYQDGDKVAFCNQQATNWLEVVTNDRGGFYSINQFETQSPIASNDKIISTSYNDKAKKGGVLTMNGNIYELSNKSLKKVVVNYLDRIDYGDFIFCDFSGDFWITTSSQGIYKVSLEPFTRIELHPLFLSQTIGFNYRTASGLILLTVYGEGTYVGKIFEPGEFQSFDFNVRAVQEVFGRTFLATNIGVLEVVSENPFKYEHRYFKNESVNMLLADGKHLWAGPAGKGLQRINIETGQIQQIKTPNNGGPDFFYTAQIVERGRAVTFGTNAGVFKYDRSDRTLTILDYPQESMGSYSGVSTKDIYGNCWFTLEKGIIGVKTNGDIVKLDNPEYFRSTLFYTLTADPYGNIIAGTNKGLTSLKLNKAGEVLSVKNYNEKSGFLGYETIMRSQFVDDDKIFLGTVEGLFIVNTSMLENQRPPVAPMIIPVEQEIVSSGSSQIYKLQVNNPKAGEITFEYKLQGITPNWIQLDPGTQFIDLSDYKTGSITIIARATYDGKNYSEISSKTIQFDIPIWKSNWFVIIMMLVVVLINILLMNYTKSLDGGKLMNTKDMVVHLSLTPSILLFGAICAPGAQIIAPLLVPELQLKIGQTLTVGFILFALYFFSLASRSKNRDYLFDIYLKIAFIVVIGEYLWEVYTSNLHPFNIIGVAIISMITPYVLNKIKFSVIYALILMSIAICFVSLLEETVYPKSYFLIAMIILSSMVIFISYLRYDSLEKLIFVSNLVNKGNLPAIAFNVEGTVTYSSENIQEFANITHDELVGSNISILNNFVPFGDSYKEKKVTDKFEEGEKYIVPMENVRGQVKWVEWSFKEFSRNIRVIFGQDVSEKMELENTYELLVQNAEDFIYRCDIDGNFVFLNDVCFGKLGYTKKELIGKKATDIIPEEQREEIANYYREHFLDLKPSSYREFPIEKKNGDIMWVGQYVTTLFSAGSNKHIIGFIALARDITEKREQQQLIRDQRDAITSSINYARRIQYNLLPQDKQVTQAFPQNFIISKPKDIVSGDFYWMHTIRNKTVLVLADCTGHGVPGSFMTLLGFNLLNSIVLENSITDPGEILNHLDRKLDEYLPRGRGKNAVNDGMEVTICVFEEDSNDFAYACAGSRFLIYEKSEFTMFKGDNKHIGDKEDNFENYNTHYYQLADHYTLYLFTDGFQDQFGGPKDKKFSFRRLLELFESNINLPMKEQSKMIDKEFKKWIGNYNQTDDITIIGIRKTKDLNEDL